MNQEDRTHLASSFSEYTSEQKNDIKTALIDVGLRHDVNAEAALVDIENKIKAALGSGPSLYSSEATGQLDRLQRAVAEVLDSYSDTNPMIKCCIDSQMGVAMLRINAEQPGALIADELPIAEKLMTGRFEWVIAAVQTAICLAGVQCQSLYPQTGRPQNVLLDRIIWFLCFVYYDLTGRMPARGSCSVSKMDTTESKLPTGPFTRFVRAVLTPTGLADEYLDHAIRKNSEKYKALLTHWQNTP